MVFTVLQYLPVLEEEAPSHKVEHAKNSSPDGTSGDSDADDDGGDSDTKADINYYPISSFIYSLNYKHTFPTKNKSWINQVETINTPPPQI